MRSSIPDIYTHDNEFTLEHCSVLLEHLGKCLDKIYGPGHSEVAQQANAEQMQEDLQSLMSSKQLLTLFNSDLGKGLIIGIFYTHFILPHETEEE